MANLKTIQIIEDICNLGCTHVNHIIDQLERGEDISETTKLTQDEASTLLHELKAIMAVYKKKDGGIV